MSEFTDGLITQHLGRHQDRWEDYLKDSAFHHETELLRRLLETTERAMEREGIAAEARRRVLETIVFGDPDEERRMTRDEARALLLTTFDPSEFERPSSPVFTEPAEDFSVRDELKPYTDPERPVSGEETSG